MTAYASTSQHRFVRDADRACLAGVCAGIAGRFGFNLCVTRLLTVIAFCAMPLTLLVYLAIVLLVPSESIRGVYRRERVKRRKPRRMSRREKREAEEESLRRESADIDRRCESLDDRLARIEKYVTSSRYELDREFRDL